MIRAGAGTHSMNRATEDPVSNPIPSDHSYLSPCDALEIQQVTIPTVNQNNNQT